MNQVDDWLERLIEENGEDLYRMKGVLSVSGSDERYVFQVIIILLTWNFHDPRFYSWLKDETLIPFLVIVIYVFVFFHVPYNSGGAFYFRWLPGQNMGT